MSFYRPFVQRYRPQRFSEVVGQNHISAILQGAFSSGRIASAYLFSGPHGIGKTSLGRIFAKLLNCASPQGNEPCCNCQSCIDIAKGRSMDVIEIDAASNRRIDEVRQLRENVKFAPSSGNYKVYIIDEVHMLTTEAFNALLKTLEEPPPYVKFILATTHAFKLPDTIISRCQRLDFRKVMPKQMSAYLKSVLQKEGVDLSDDVISVVVSASNGSMRDAESLLEQAVILSACGQSDEDIISVLSMHVSGQVVAGLAKEIARSDAKVAVELLAKAVLNGVDLMNLSEALRRLFRDVLFIKQGVSEDLLNMVVDLDSLKEVSDLLTADEAFYILQVFLKLESWMRPSPLKRLPFEMAVVKAALRSGVKSWEEIFSKAHSYKASVPAQAVQPASSQEVRQMPPARPAKRAKPSPAAEIWKKAITDIMKAGNTLLAHSMQDVASVAGENGRLSVVFKHKFAYDTALNSKNKAIIEETVGRIIGKKVPIVFTCAQQSDVPKDKDFEEKVDYLLKTFGGKIVGRGRLK